ncbi:PAS domain-containing protein [Sulfurospirillum sp. 1612]|uniref:PAS domain-containing protein n=1 Tax=Sulfurospirillum sp. 1612 TaxID=3094835 RepID=UPI002F94DF4E
MKRPDAIDEEIVLDPSKYIVSKTDPKGIIEYANDYFVEISGYGREELIGTPHNILRHPDMPRIVFKMMWDRIKKSENITALVKNLAKNGKYYWVVTEFETKKDKRTRKIISYTAFRKAAPRDAIEKIIPIYKKLIALEKIGGMEASEKFLVEFLKENNTTYDEYIDNIVQNKGLFKMFFAAMRKLFK